MSRYIAALTARRDALAAEVERQEHDGKDLELVEDRDGATP